MPPGEPSLERTAPRPGGGLARIARYALVRAAMLALMVVLSVYLAIVVLNYGGYIDKIREGAIEEALLMVSTKMPGASAEEIAAETARLRQEWQAQFGLDEPFLVRSLRWTYEALTFQWGESMFFQATQGYVFDWQPVTRIILTTLPNTLLLVGVANLLLITASIVLALACVRGQGNLLDRAVVAFAPISSVPNWVYGVVLVVILAGELRVLPFGGMFDQFPPATKLGYLFVVLKHMVLPVLAIFLSQFFQTVYTWRTYFLIHSGEDYVELARAKGLPATMIERRYVLRPALPYMVTSFALMLITSWQAVLVLETFFEWPGVGRLFLAAVQFNQQRLTVAIIVLFALLLATSVFVLDFMYAVVDPRVKITGRGRAQRPAGRRRRSFKPFWRRQSPSPAPRPSLPHSPRRITAAPRRDTATGGAPAGPARRAGPPRLAGLAAGLRTVARYPTAAIGLVAIAALMGVSVYAMIAIPYRQAVEAWRPQAADREYRPRNAQPTWVNLFRRDKLPATVIQDSRDGTALKTIVPARDGGTRTTITFTLDYPYTTFPEDLIVHFYAAYQAKRPYAALTWRTPDGHTLELGGFSVVSGQSFQVSEDLPLKYVQGSGVRQTARGGGTGGTSPAEILWRDPATASGSSTAWRALPGRYTLRVDGYTFEPGSTVDADLVMWGKVYGPAGTDYMRRDLSVALLWGTPVALIIGIAGAIATSLLSMLVAAAGAWLGGWVDDLVQRMTEINMILPALPMAIMIFYLYSQNVWVILGVIVLLSVFGSGVKTYRAAFLQLREAPYIEAAQTYGASSWRIIRRYLVPRILPLLIPQLVILIPTYVFFEATLAYLGISDPYLPTWGKVVYDAVRGGLPNGHYYWLLEPITLMMITGLAFAMVGFALDSLLNPRLRRE